jgi:disulfide bond formation protein DsbB
MEKLNPRIVFAAMVVACVSLASFGIFYLQAELGLDPCPMCILQRYAFFAIAAVALAAAIHGPKATALKVYAGLVVLFAIAGGATAIRHSYLQHFPPKVETCGTDLEFLMNTFPLAQALPRIFAGTGSCSRVDWKFLGLSIPEWALVWFVIFAVAALCIAFARRPRA